MPRMHHKEASAGCKWKKDLFTDTDFHTELFAKAIKIAIGLFYVFLVARSDSRRTKFNERALELRNCRKRRLVSRESSVVSRPFSSLRDRRGFPSSFYAVCSLALLVPTRIKCEEGNALRGLIDWLIDWLIDCLSLYWSRSNTRYKMRIELSRNHFFLFFFVRGLTPRGERACPKEPKASH